LPEPSKDPIVSDDPKYGNGVKAESTNETTPLTSFTVEDQQAERTKAIKKAEKIPAGNTLERSKPKGKKERGW